MSLVPIIQPPVMKLLTTREERKIRMEYAPRPVSRRALVLFPIVVTLVIGLLVPDATPLISMLMLGNLLRESRVVERLTRAAENEIINIATLFLGLTVGSTMTAESFLRVDTLRDPDPGAAGVRAGHGGRAAVRQADGARQWRQDQPADRRGESAPSRWRGGWRRRSRRTKTSRTSS